MKAVSIFDAKTHLSSLINEVVEYNEQIAITKHGHTVAMLVPAKTTVQSDIKQVLKEMQELSDEIGKTGMTLKEIQRMRDEGRR